MEICKKNSRQALPFCTLMSTKTITLEYSAPLTYKGLPGFEKIPFTQKDYNAIFESRKIFDNYIDQINVLDKDIKEQINAKCLPLITKEHFYALKKKQQLVSGEENLKNKISNDFGEKINAETNQAENQPILLDNLLTQPNRDISSQNQAPLFQQIDNIEPNVS